MTALRIETIAVPTALLGPPSRLPSLRPLGSHSGEELDLTAAAAVLGPQVNYGRVPTMLPYTLQWDYDRHLEARETPVAVLENEHLRAVFLLAYGGRLWSLTDLDTGQDLLFTNKVLQPANLAIRGAWFAGGVEWNIGTIGHCPLTMSPVHAARFTCADGSPGLRLYEWERIRSVVFQVDVVLPRDSRVLVVVPRIRNHHASEVPMYWWSNIAVPEGRGTRVLVPATSAYRLGADRDVNVVPVPGSVTSLSGGSDCTHPADVPHAADWFFDVGSARRPWIAAVDQHGEGLAQVSTRRLRGRKLFCWGNRVGGRHWQDWLSAGTGAYFEIQAGLATTQLEHVPMPPRSEWSWAEAYGALRVEPGLVHGRDWNAATAEVDRALDDLAPMSFLDGWLEEIDTLASLAPDEHLHLGSGWGALERRRLEVNGSEVPDWTGTPFPDESLDDEQADWTGLLDGRPLPTHAAPTSYVSGTGWLTLLEGAPRSWSSLLHAGVARYAAGDVGGAREAWQASTCERPNVPALWALGMLASLDGDAAESVALLQRAYDLALAGDAGSDLGTVHEVLLGLLEVLVAHDPSAALALVGPVDGGARSSGRLLLLEARAALAAGDPERCTRILASKAAVPDVREGEVSFEDVWRALNAGDAASPPVPYHYDFEA